MLFLFQSGNVDVCSMVSLKVVISLPFFLSRVPQQGQRRGYVPKNPEDFGDGGAFPEIHIVQYPRNMGRPGVKSTAIVAVDVGEKGEVRFDAIVRQGANREKIIHSGIDAVKEGVSSDIALPSEEEEMETTERTRKALEALVEGKIKKATVGGAVVQKTATEEPKYISYTPNPDAPGYVCIHNMMTSIQNLTCDRS